MNTRLSAGISDAELRSAGVLGTLSVAEDEGDRVIVEFTPAKPQLQVVRKAVRRGAELSLLLTRLGVPKGYHAKLAAASSWSREVTILPDEGYRRQFGGR